MPAPARAQWWTHVIGTDTAPLYKTAAKAQRDDGQKSSPKSEARRFIWGDRVRVLEEDGDARKVSGRDKQMWLHKRHLDGTPLLELYVIDVGQGDGLLVVTPEGHHLMVDGGDRRYRTNGGKNAADFIDWKFAQDYLNYADQRDPDKTAIKLDAMIATHNDIDHFGGCHDLIDRTPRNQAELSSDKTTVEVLYHAGLSWWFSHFSGRNKTTRERRLGDQTGDHYTQLLTDRASAIAATDRLEAPDRQTLTGAWGNFIKSALGMRRGDGTPTPLHRLSNQTDAYLPGFAPGGASACSIRVLGPIEETVQGAPGLRNYSGGTSKNTNGHSVVLRLDYGARRLLLTGDLNTASQHHIIETYGEKFVDEYMVDMAKGCHHGSHDVSYRFLDGLRPLVTVISSGDAETHDHPRPTIVAASALTGRRLMDETGDRLLAPMIYMTEVSRSVKLSDAHTLAEYHDRTPAYAAKRPKGVKQNHDKPEEIERFRLLLSSSPTKPSQWPRVDKVQAVQGLRYGLVNVRTDGKRLFMAQMEERGTDWAIHILTDEQIRAAR